MKKYADEHGENISDVCRKAIEEFLAGSPAPSPPSNEISEIKKRLDELNKKIDEILIKGKWWIAGLIGLIMHFATTYFTHLGHGSDSLSSF